jgi:hypothetical protein
MAAAFVSIAAAAALTVVVLPDSRTPPIGDVLRMVAILGGLGGLLMLALAGVLEHWRYVAQARATAQDEWRRSYRTFRDHITVVCAHVRSALDIPGAPRDRDWNTLASRSRYPDHMVKGLANRSVGWLDAERALLDTTAEQPLFAIAEHVVAVDLNTFGFVLARSHATDEISRWVTWRNEEAIREEVERALKDQRRVLVLLAFLEVAQAVKIGPVAGVPDAWVELCDHWGWIENP